MNRTSKPILLASALFLVSGFAALVYQVIWQRVLGIFSGQHIYSITLIVTAFMAGLGFGSLLAGKLADRLARRGAVLGFALCELLIGLFALLSPWLYYDVAYVRLGHLVRLPAVVPLVHFSMLLVPTLLMGASLPLLARGLVRGSGTAARTIGVLYGVNTLGAALGAFVSVWYLIGALGFSGTVRLASLLNFLAFLGALWMLRVMRGADASGSEPTEEPAATPGPDHAAPRALGFGSWATVYALSGFIALSLEILWFRILDVSIKSSPYTFGHLLGMFLLFLALGSLVGSAQVGRGRRPDLIFLWGQWGIGVSAALALLSLCYFPANWWPLSGLFEFWSTDRGIVMIEIAEALRGEGAGETLLRATQIYLLLPPLLLGVPTFLMGLTFAYIQRTVQTDLSAVGWRVGMIQTANIAGSIAGSLVTGGLLLKLLGTPGSLRLVILCGALYGLLAVSRGKASAPRSLGVVGVSLLLAALVPTENAFWARFHGSAPADLIASEDLSSIVALQRLGPQSAVLRVNGTGHSMLPYGGAHTQLGGIPVLMHPDPREVLLIGLGAGNTAWAAGSRPEVERIDLYEIARPEHDVLKRFVGHWFRLPALEAFLEDPRMRLTFSDGRLALRLEDRRYDVIEADALEPYMAYSGNLYSLEFFELARSRLKPGGIVCTYSPTERTVRTVAQAFPHVLLFSGPGNLHFAVGSNEPIDYDARRVLERLHSPPVKQYFGVSGVTQAIRDIEIYVRGARVVRIRPEDREEFFGGEDVNRDLYPRDEYDKGVAVE